jgi:hypothetical protein
MTTLQLLRHIAWRILKDVAHSPQIGTDLVELCVCLGKMPTLCAQYLQ